MVSYVQDPATKKYSIGYGVLEVAAGLLRGMSVVDAAKPFMSALSASTGENTHVAVREPARGRFGRFRVRFRHTARRNKGRIGRAPALHGSGEGAALRLYVCAARRAFRRRAAAALYAQTITTLDLLDAELARVRRLGYSLDDEELHPGVRCIAAPVRDHLGRVVAAFGISSPAVRLSRARIPELAEEIRTAAAAISVQLGNTAQRAPALP